MEFKLAEKIERKACTVSTYGAEGSSYILKKRDFTTYSLFSVCRTSNSDYLPTIHINDNMDGHVESFDIQTTSYGTLAVEDIEKVIEGYKIAVETVKALEKLFFGGN